MRGVMAIVGLAAVALGVAHLGRARVRRELSPLGEQDAAAVASQMTTTESLYAGLRVLVGRSAFGTQATVNVSN